MYVSSEVVTGSYFELIHMSVAVLQASFLLIPGFAYLPFFFPCCKILSLYKTEYIFFKFSDEQRTLINFSLSDDLLIIKGHVNCSKSNSFNLV